MRVSFSVLSPRASLVGSLCAVALVVTPAAPALAQPRRPPAAKPEAKNNEAKKLFDDGAAAYTQGNYEAAIEAWSKAYEISKKPLIFESIANAYERLGEAKKAREYLAKWRDVAPKDEQDLLDARIKNLDARVIRDEELETARKVEAEKSGRAEEERNRQRAPGGGGGTSVPGVVLIGVGGAAVAVGVTLDIIAGIRRPAPDTACKTVDTGQICKSSSRDAISSSNTLALAGDILWIVGAAAAVGGAALVITHKPPAGKEGTAPTATWIAPAGAGFMAGHSF
jgi:tetratricopeptide (TPR) repeat protein